MPGETIPLEQSQWAERVSPRKAGFVIEGAGSPASRLPALPLRPAKRMGRAQLTFHHMHGNDDADQPRCSKQETADHVGGKMNAKIDA